MALQVNATGQAAPVVQTSSGKVVGLVEKGYTDIPIYSYKGIPYAADTSGANRWQPPQDPEPWSGVRSTTTWGHMCMQPDPRKDAFQEVVANASGFDFKNILDSRRRACARIRTGCLAWHRERRYRACDHQLQARLLGLLCSPGAQCHELWSEGSNQGLGVGSG